MNENSTIQAKEILLQFAENCKNYRDFESEVRIANEELVNSENNINTLNAEIDKLALDIGDEMPDSPDKIKEDTSNMIEEKSKLGFFSFRSKKEINSLLEIKQKELSEAINKNKLITELEEKKKSFSLIYEKEKEKQIKFKDVIETKGKELPNIIALVNKCIELFQNVPTESLSHLISEGGSDMAYLPNSILKRTVENNVFNFLEDMSVDRQVKLLYPYNVPIHFAGKKWNVLEIKQNRALLLLNDYYTCAAYYRPKYAWETEQRVANAFHRKEKKRLTWEESEARKILNENFINSLFPKENEKILLSDTGDKVFCLSESEVNQYLTQRQRTIDCCWWLRNTKYYAGGEYSEPDLTSEVAYVDMHGNIKYNPNTWEIPMGNSTYNMCFRPALWVELPYDSLDDEWNKTNVNINCKGNWTVENSFSNIAVDVDSLIRRVNDKCNNNGSNSSASSSGDDWLPTHIDVTDM